MASTFKHFLSSDATSTRTLLHESIPLTGTIVSGTYGGKTVALGSEGHVKSYAHGMFQSVYDYPHLSSSANHIFDISVGISGSSKHKIRNQASKKANMYSQMAQILAGNDVDGSVRDFDVNGDLTEGEKHGEVVFITLSRLLVKDEIKKGSFSMKVSNRTNFAHSSLGSLVTIADTGAATAFKTNSPVGEYGILKDGSDNSVGLLYYQAGVVVLTGSVFGSAQMTADPRTFPHAIASSSIDQLSNGVRNRIANISFNNTTELNSTVYFCRANHNEFNYSSNVTYLDNSTIRVKGTSAATAPRSYVTTVGLYSADNELLAVAKLSEPLRKDPTNELTLKVRLDY